MAPRCRALPAHRAFTATALAMALTLLPAPAAAETAAASHSGIAVYLPSPHLEAAPGESLPVDVKVTNRLGAAATVHLASTVIGAGWTISPATERFTLASQETKTLRYTLQAPHEAGSTARLKWTAHTKDPAGTATLAGIGEGTARVEKPAAGSIPAEEVRFDAREEPLLQATHRDGQESLALNTVAPASPGAEGAAIPLVATVTVAAGSLAAAGVVLWRREAWRSALLAPLAGLFSRLAKPQVLGHETRDRLYAMIQAEPGITFAALKTGVGFATGVVVHHLQTLERHQFVVSQRDGVNRRFYPVGARVPAARATGEALTPMQERILIVLAAGPLPQRALADQLGITKQGVNYHVKLLQPKGLLELRLEEDGWVCAAVAAPTAPSSPSPDRSGGSGSLQ